MDQPQTVTGNVVYWIVRIATSAFIVVALLAAVIYIGRAVIRSARRLFGSRPTQ
jgi:xanthosine utilization system XapX-like protein